MRLESSRFNAAAKTDCKNSLASFVSRCCKPEPVIPSRSAKLSIEARARPSQPVGYDLPLTAAVFDEKAMWPRAFITDNGTVTRAPEIRVADDA